VLEIMDGNSTKESGCPPCMDLVGAGPRIDPHHALRAAKDSAEKYLYRCSLCHAFWALAAHGWARLME
jgi:acetyl esterase/lipase